jgi:hypothetical protein
VTFAVLADPNHEMYDEVDGRFVEKLIVGDLDGGEQELFGFKAGHPPVLPAGLTVPHHASGVKSTLRHFADCYALLRMRPLSISCAECSVVISCGNVDYDISG